MTSKAIDKLTNIADNFDKKAQANSNIDNVVMVLSGLFSIAVSLENKNFNSETLSNMLETVRKLNPSLPADMVKAKQMADSIKDIANYIQKQSALLNKI